MHRRHHHRVESATDVPAREASKHAEKLEGKGIVGVGYWHNGFKVMSANKALRMPTDMKGLKMRIQSSKVLTDEMCGSRREQPSSGPAPKFT